MQHLYTPSLNFLRSLFGYCLLILGPALGLIFYHLYHLYQELSKGWRHEVKSAK